MLPSIEEHTNAVLAALEDAGLAVGDGIAPKPPPKKYVVLYPIPGGRVLGTLAEPSADAELVYQVTCVGTSRQQVHWLVDVARDAVLGGITVAGRHIPYVKPEGGQPEVKRDEEQTPPIFYAPFRFRLMTLPGKP